MNWGDVRYGTVIRTTERRAHRGLTLMIVGVGDAVAHFKAVLLAADDPGTFWEVNKVSEIDVEDFWRFEVVE